MSYRESGDAAELFICGSCYRTVSPRVDVPCHSCGLTRVPLADESVKADVRNFAEKEIERLADRESENPLAILIALALRLLKRPSAAATMRWRRLRSSDVREYNSSLDTGYRPHDYFKGLSPIPDPAGMTIPELLQWLKVVEE